ncbi:MAG: ABC transporter permease [Vicinamibacterales bacterium]
MLGGCACAPPASMPTASPSWRPTHGTRAPRTVDGARWKKVRRQLEARPDVQRVTVTRGWPMQTTGVRLLDDRAGSGRDEARPAGAIWAAPGYFEALRIPLVHGRLFDERDGADAGPAAVINVSLARRLFGTSDATGRRLRLDREPAVWMQVVGVVADTGTSDRAGDLVDPTPWLLYRPIAQSDQPPSVVFARTAGDGAALVGEMRQALRRADPSLPVIAAGTLASHLDDSLAVSTRIAQSLAGLGLLGVCLAAVGLYAVVAFSVLQRIREIGIRMALGASRPRVAWSVTRGAIGLVGAGTAIGLALSVAVVVALRAAAAPAPGITLYRPSVNPAGLAWIAAAMAVVAIAAAYVPARRAARLDPLVAMRRE